MAALSKTFESQRIMSQARGLILSVLRLPKWAKQSVVMAFDAIACFASVIIAFYLRLGTWPAIEENIIVPFAVATLTVVPLSIAFGAYREVFRYTGATALITTTKVILCHSLIFSTIFLFYGFTGIPRTVGLIQPVVLFVLMSSIRIGASAFLGQSVGNLWTKADSRAVMIYGAGRAGRQLATAIRASSDMMLAGFVDDDPALQGRKLNGARIYGPDDLKLVVVANKVTDIIIAMPSVGRVRKAEILDQLAHLKLHVRTIPSLSDIATGKITVSDLKQLEIGDLLGRASVPPDADLLQAAIPNRVIMVTGAGGSIGSELCRQISAFRPARLVLIDNSEYMLYSIHEELRNGASSGTDQAFSLIPILASVTDEARIEKVIETWKPDCIFHAAAYKHVPLVEGNPLEGVRNNVFGTLTVARAALKHEVESLMLVSTDKAVRPTNVMGASKRLAELVLQALQANSPETSTRFSMVRFGNVLDSNGSVVPLFREQIRRGGPVTVTHPDVVRYFMTIPEAAQLVIQAGAMASGGDVFLLDMGEPVKIIDLARKMIELSGMTVRDHDHPSGDLAIEIVGLRPGEKLYEELLIDAASSPTDHPRILRARETYIPWSQLQKGLDRISAAIANNDTVELIDTLRSLVAEYKPKTVQQPTLRTVKSA